MKFVDVKNDVAFHKIFGNPSNAVALISLLNAVLFADGSNRLLSATVASPYLFPPVPVGKTSIMDVFVTDQEGVEFIVEVQIVDRYGFEKRAHYYVSGEFSAEIDGGDDFIVRIPTYIIGILDFNVTINPNYFSIDQTRDIEMEANLLKGVKYHFIELKKFHKEENELLELVDKWAYFFKNSQNLDLIPSNVDDEGLKTAYINADQQTWTKAELNIYNDSKVQEADIVQRELLLFEKVEQMKIEVEQKKIEIEQRELKAEQKKIEVEQREIEIEQKKVEIEQREFKLIQGMVAAGMPISQIAAIAEKTEQEVREILAKQR